MFEPTLVPNAGRLPRMLDLGPESPALPRIVALGGGTGLGVVLHGLRSLYYLSARAADADCDRLTAVVTVADDGGSSGSLRRAFRMLAPGDIRNCLLALSDADPTLQALFNFRFDDKVGGHSLGNLMLTALTVLEKDFTRAVELAGKLLAVRGRVWPATADEVDLLAEFSDGSCAMGESCIASVGRSISRVSLVPAGARALPQAVGAIGAADLVVLGPGSLYTSLLPTLLVRDIVGAIAESQARVVLVMNLMSEPGETDGYCAMDVLDAIHRHAPELCIHSVVLNDATIPATLMRRYADEGASPITYDPASIQAAGYRPVCRPLLGDGPLVRHDPRKLAQALLDIAIKDTP